MGQGDPAPLMSNSAHDAAVTTAPLPLRPQSILQVHQSYLRDYRALKLQGIEDDAMTFSNPVDRAAGSVAAAS
mgnify:CR=1 FL=1